MSKARDLADFISDSTIETAEIADGAVTAGKLNVTGNGTLGQALTSDADGSFSWTTITSDLVDDASPQLGADLDTNGNDITFGDNDKAIFGAGSDLQIYHDGSNSKITDVGTGSLLLGAAGQLYIQNETHTENMARFTANSSVELYYDNSKKFETTSTGIDVTGTVTAENGSNLITDNAFDIEPNGGGSSQGGIGAVAGGVVGINGNNQVQINTVSTRRFRIDQSGDISFYEDTGTTPKLFWDASAENLGLGTTSPVASNSNHRAIQIHHPDIYQAQLRLTNSTSGAGANDGFNIQFDGTDVYLVNQESTGDIIAYTNSNERMRIDSSGNVGIGTNIPNGLLTLDSGALSFYGSISTPSIGAGIFRPANNAVAFVTGQTERMRINSSGNVGIGTSSPNAKLMVSYGNNAPNSSGNMTNGSVFSNSGTLSALQIGSTGSYTYLNSGYSNNSGVGVDLRFYCGGGTERMRLSSNGLFQMDSGYGSIKVAYGCRAWVNFEGFNPAVIRASGNISSVGYTGTGSYTVNLATAMVDANYAINVSASTDPEGGSSFGTFSGHSNYGPVPTTTAFHVQGYSDSGSIRNKYYMMVTIFR